MEEFVLPKDFEEKMKRLLKDEWEAFIDCYENQRYQALRINSLKQNSNDVKEKEAFYRFVLGVLGMDEMVRVPWAGNGYYYDANLRPGKHAFHEMGIYYIQEPSAMSAAGLLDAKPGETVLDLCAAPGGKSTQIAASLQGKGLLVANEIHPARCKILSQNIERMGIGNALVTNEEPGALAAHFPVFFDKILVDAPCSGEGMFRKNPDAMSEWSLDSVKMCANRQADILQKAAVMLKPGGRLVYSTCTFSPEEDEMSIAHFLKTHPDFEIERAASPFFDPARPEWVNEDGDDFGLEYTYRLWPHKLHGEGHYVAVLKKKETCYHPVDDTIVCCENGKAEQGIAQAQKKNKRKQTQKKGNGEILTKDQKQSLETVYREALEAGVIETLSGAQYILYGDNLYALPQGIISIAGIKVERPGLQIGTFKKDRFEPAHALALALKKEDVKLYVNLPLKDNRVNGYFRGESFFLQEGELFTSANEKIKDIYNKKGFCMVCVEGFPAGWGKLSNGQIKNHYPKGLRKEL